MTTTLNLACDAQTVKRLLLDHVERAVVWLFAEAEAGVSARRLEQSVWCAVLAVGVTLLGAALAVRCRRSMRDEVAARGVEEGDVRVRGGDDYRATLTTTFGKVSFPTFAYRDLCNGRPVGATRTPAQADVLPLFPHCRSSELLVEWESRLGSQMPFRHAQKALTFFTHGAVTVEDTTIARHMVAAGRLVDSSWQYRKRDEIRTILLNDAVRDPKTGRPLLYVSTDAHALRRYEDETWRAEWKMANGIRLWCVNACTGKIIHLGGEYTWGDCEEVVALFGKLDDSGLLPADGDYGEGLQAQIVLLTDGAPWIRERILVLFPGAIEVLDAYHAMERAAKEAAAIYGQGTEAAKAWYRDVVRAMLGTEHEKVERKPKKRKGHKKRRRGQQRANRQRPDAPASKGHDSVAALMDLVLLETWLDPSHPYAEGYETYVRFVESNADRMNYAELRDRGIQIGSGAMEALHPVASQARLKRPGARWLRRTSQAIFGLRMMGLVERWDEFWGQPDLASRLAVELATTNTMRTA